MGVVVLLLWASFSDAGAIFLTIPKSAQMAGMGYTGVARWEDPSASYLNPAAGVFQQDLSATVLNTITFGAGELLIHAILESQGIPRQPNWLDSLANDMENHYWEIGWTQELHHRFYQRLSIRISGTRLNWGTALAFDEHGNYLGSWSPYDQATSLNVSMLFPYGISLGYTLKYVYSFLAPNDIIRLIYGEDIHGEARTLTNDYGLLFDPGMGFAIGIALYNHGGSMKYASNATPEPMPTYLRYGFTLKLRDLLEKVIGEPFSTLITLTYSRDWMKDRVGIQHETWSGKGFEVGFLDVFFYREGTFRDISGMRVGQTKGWGIRLGAINLDVADDGDIYFFHQPHNWWVSLSLQTPQKEGFLDRWIGKKVMGWAQALLFPGAGHIYEGNERGLLYSALSSFLYSMYARQGSRISLFGASVVYALSLVDYFLTR